MIEPSSINSFANLINIDYQITLSDCFFVSSFIVLSIMSVLLIFDVRVVNFKSLKVDYFTCI